MTLLELRIKYNLTQSDMANILDTSQPTYHRIEQKRNIKDLTISQLEKIAYILDYSLLEIINKIYIRKDGI